VHPVRHEPGEQRDPPGNGSTVEMDSRSACASSHGRRRTVELLDGQALFVFSPKTSRPHCRERRHASACGGHSFDVYKKRDARRYGYRRTVAVLAPGQARKCPRCGRWPDSIRRCRERNPALFLSSGEQVTISARIAPQAIRTNVAVATAWTQGQLVLESATLSEAAEEFNRYSARRLIVQDTGAHPLRLSGVFVTDPDFLIRYLKARAISRARD